IGSVPISHSINAYNILAHPQDRLTQAQIKFFDSKATIPPSLTTASKDQSYGNRQPIFRRSSGNARLTIFDGGHEMIPSALIKWLEDMKQNHVAD
ncbi:MAG: prolyl oligopeptidase, partial [Opitutae bacterium]